MKLRVLSGRATMALFILQIVPVPLIDFLAFDA